MGRPHAPALTGRVIAGRYHVGFPVHSGRQDGPCYARDLALDLPVVVRVLGMERALGLTATWDRMERARVALKLRNEHTARVRDVGFLPNGVGYVVSDAVDGPSLRAFAWGAATDGWKESLRWIGQTAASVAEAHEIGLAHRHLRPENLILTALAGEELAIRVLGFGVPDWRDAGDPEAIAYRAPEQLAGELGDQRADVWSLGVILFELLEGHRPFEAGSAPDRAASRVLTPRFVRFSGPERNDVEQLVSRCLNPDPTHRYPSARALLDALAPILRERRASGSRFQRQFVSAAHTETNTRTWLSSGTDA